MLDDLSVSIVLNTEGVIQDTSDVIVPDEDSETKNQLASMKPEEGWYIYWK